MKKILLIISLISVVACQNKRDEIINQQIRITGQIDSANRLLDTISWEIEEFRIRH